MRTFVLLTLCVAAALAACGDGGVSSCALDGLPKTDANGLPLLGCGNHKCDIPHEDCSSCPTDCGVCPSCDPVCGDGYCDFGETPCSCRGDCGVCCVNGVCETAAGEHVDNCPLDCSATIRGKVVDGETGAALGNPNPLGVTMIECNGRSGRFEAAVDGFGEFSFDPVRPGDWQCIARLATYSPGGVAVTLGPGDRPSADNFEVKLYSKTGSLTTVVTDAVSAHPVADAAVDCHGPDGVVMSRVSNLAGESYYLSLPANRQPNDDSAQNGDEWNCTVSRECYTQQTASTRVVAGEGARLPISATRVHATLEVSVQEFYTGASLDGEQFSIECKAEFVHPAWSAAPQTVTGAQRATFVAVPDGGYACTVRSLSGKYMSGGCEIVDVHGCAPVHLPIGVKPKTGIISGNVTESPSGMLVEHALVVCTPVDPAQRGGVGSDQTGSDGNLVEKFEFGVFVIGGMQPGEYDCVARERTGYLDSAPSRVTVHAAETTVVALSMTALPGAVVGRVSEPANFGGAVVEGVSVTCVDESSDLSYSTVTGAVVDGRNNFRIDPVAPGSLRCTFARTGYESSTRSAVDVVSNQAVRIDGTVTPLLGSITMRVVDATTSLDVAEAQARCRGLDGSTYDVRVPAVAQGSGPYLFAGPTTLRAGRYECSCRSDPLYVSNELIIVDLQGGEARDVRCNVQPKPAVLIGTVTSSDTGAPIDAASVECLFDSAPGRSFAAQTDSTGNYQIGNIDVFGVARCEVRHPDYESALGEVNVVISQTRVLDVELSELRAIITITVRDRQTDDDLLSNVQCDGPFGYSEQLPADGSFATGDRTFSSLRAGTYACQPSADAVEYTCDAPTDIAVSGTGETRLTLFCSPNPCTMSGLVNDAEFGALADASVACVVTPDDLRRDPINVAETSAADGTYSFSASEFGAVVCTGSKAFFAGDTQQARCERGRASTVPALTLTADPSSVSGYVFEAFSEFRGHRVVEGATVRSAEFDDRVTDAMGAWAVDPASRQVYSAMAVLSPATLNLTEGSLADAVCDPAEFCTGTARLIEGQHVQINFTLTPMPSTLFVNVTDASNFAPVPSAVVNCQRVEDSVALPPITTGDDGGADFGTVQGEACYACTAGRVGFENTAANATCVSFGVDADIVIEIVPL